MLNHVLIFAANHDKFKLIRSTLKRDLSYSRAMRKISLYMKNMVQCADLESFHNKPGWLQFLLSDKRNLMKVKNIKLYKI